VRSLDEQLGRVLDAAVRPEPVRVAISEAQGMLCAEEVVAQRALPGFDQDAVKELKDKYRAEGLEGVSVRYGQNKISNALSSNFKYINPFMVLKELEEGLHSYPLIKNEDEKRYYQTCIDVAKEEFEELAKNDVQEALVSDDNAIVR